MSATFENPAETREEVEKLCRALRDERRQAALFTESVIPIGLAMLRETDLDRLLETILREARRLAFTDGATLYMRRGDVLDFFMVINVSLGIEMGGAGGKAITFPPLLLTTVDGKSNLTSAACFCALRRETLNLKDIREPNRFDFSGSRRFDEMHGYHTKSLLTVPMADAEGEIVAVLQMINAQDPETGELTAFSPSLQRTIESLAALAAGALESFKVKRLLYEKQQLYLRNLETTQARLREELDQAERYVRAILPAPIETPLKIDWLLAPCSELGGDSFGYHEIDADHWALYILDVCGHGLAAALLSVTAVKMVRSSALPGVDFRDPGQVLTALNKAFPMRQQNNFYFTIWYGVYRISTRELRFSSAGHAPAILALPEMGTATKLEARGMVLGVRENKVYANHSIVLPPRAILYLLSDGTYEIRRPSGELWPFAEFLHMLALLPPGDAGALHRLIESVRQVRAPASLEDDFSVVRISL